MISHVYIGITDFPRALAFYTPVLDSLGLVLKFSDPYKPWAGWMSPKGPRPLLLIGTPFNGDIAHPGNGQMVALLAPTRAAVVQCHALALRLGAQCEGPPRLRPQYHDHYFGAYFRDADGNKLGVCCHDPV